MRVKELITIHMGCIRRELESLLDALWKGRNDQAVKRIDKIISRLQRIKKSILSEGK